MTEFLRLIADEEDGFSLGTPWQYKKESSLILLPILRESDKERRYKILREAQEAKISDSGSIDRLSIENNEDIPIYVRIGELFGGETQERAAIQSYIIFNSEKSDITVRCVHASRGINTDAGMESVGITPPDFEMDFIIKNYEKEVIWQGEVWDKVQATSARMSASSSSAAGTSTSPTHSSSSTGTSASDTFVRAADDDLKAGMDQFGELLKDILQQVPYVENQTGLATIDSNGIIAVEVFDLAASWEAMRDYVISKEGEDLIAEEEDEFLEINRNKIVSEIKHILTADFEERVITKTEDSRVVGIANDHYAGEVVELNGSVIHCLIVRRPSQEKEF
ncbi:MAG: ARPP-1 family domain-containing protein [Candidatus Thorarchaeota archaeon]|jgi:hypothetical protein